ncbi:MAG: hypothetical protein ACI8TL_001257, partial [Natronomonas sp.]
MAPPGNDERDDRTDDSDPGDKTTDQRWTDRDHSATPDERSDPASGLNERERLIPESGPHSTGLNEKPPERRTSGTRPSRGQQPQPNGSPTAPPDSHRPAESNRRPRPSDPVQASFTGQVDLYEIASWEVRSPLDRFAVRLTNALETSRRLLLLALAFTLFLAQIAIAGVLIFEAPVLGARSVASALP